MLTHGRSRITAVTAGAALAAVALAAGGVSVARAGITYTTQDRHVSALGPSQAAPDFGPFDATATNGGSVGNNNSFTGSAHQVSTLDSSGIHVSADVRLDVDNPPRPQFVDIESAAGATFTLDQPYHYDLTFSPVTGYNGAGGYQLQLFQVLGNGPGQSSKVFDFLHAEGDPAPNPLPPTAGVLQAGNYSFFYDETIETVTGNPTYPVALRAGHSADLNLSVLTGGGSGGSGGPTPVPLPPGAWPGLAMLVGGGLLTAWRRRRRAGAGA